MTATGHALTGALVATVVKQPLLAVPLAFLSHFVCDALPHLGFDDFTFGGKKMRYWLAADGPLVAAVFVWIILYLQNPLLLIIAAVTAMSPDLAWLYHGIRGRDDNQHGRLTKFHGAIQKYEKPFGVIVDVAWSLAVIVGIVKLQ